MARQSPVNSEVAPEDAGDMFQINGEPIPLQSKERLDAKTSRTGTEISRKASGPARSVAFLKPLTIQVSFRRTTMLLRHLNRHVAPVAWVPKTSLVSKASTVTC